MMELSFLLSVKIKKNKNPKEMLGNRTNWTRLKSITHQHTTKLSIFCGALANSHLYTQTQETLLTSYLPKNEVK